MRVRPFPCGSQYGDWTDANCRRCRKGADVENPPARCGCDIEQALLEACFGDGDVTTEVAERMGRKPSEDRYNWPCRELEIVR